MENAKFNKALLIAGSSILPLHHGNATKRFLCQQMHCKCLSEAHDAIPSKYLRFVCKKVCPVILSFIEGKKGIATREIIMLTANLQFTRLGHVNTFGNI